MESTNKKINEILRSTAKNQRSFISDFEKSFLDIIDESNLIPPKTGILQMEMAMMSMNHNMCIEFDIAGTLGQTIPELKKVIGAHINEIMTGDSIFPPQMSDSMTIHRVVPKFKLVDTRSLRVRELAESYGKLSDIISARHISIQAHSSGKITGLSGLFDMPGLSVVDGIICYEIMNEHLASGNKPEFIKAMIKAGLRDML